MKHRSPVDVGALGGWDSPDTMQNVYQRATVEDMELALDAGDPGRVVGEST